MQSKGKTDMNGQTGYRSQIKDTCSDISAEKESMGNSIRMTKT